MTMTKRNRFIGGTDSIYVGPIFQAYVREYTQQKIALYYGAVPPFLDPGIPIEYITRSLNHYG